MRYGELVFTVSRAYLIQSSKIFIATLVWVSLSKQGFEILPKPYQIHIFSETTHHHQSLPPYFTIFLQENFHFLHAFPFSNTQEALLLHYKNTELQIRFITHFYTETACNHLPEGLLFFLISS